MALKGDLNRIFQTFNNKEDIKQNVEKNVKEVVLDYELYVNCFKESKEFLFSNLWKNIIENKDSFDKHMNSIRPKTLFLNDKKIQYFLKKYELKMYFDDEETAYKKIFGDFEK